MVYIIDKHNYILYYLYIAQTFTHIKESTLTPEIHRIDNHTLIDSY